VVVAICHEIEVKLNCLWRSWT